MQNMHSTKYVFNEMDGNLSLTNERKKKSVFCLCISMIVGQIDVDRIANRCITIIVWILISLHFFPLSLSLSFSLLPFLS